MESLLTTVTAICGNGGNTCKISEETAKGEAGKTDGWECQRRQDEARLDQVTQDSFLRLGSEGLPQFL